MSLPVRRRVTLKDIGRKLGLSERAVSQALSDNHNSTAKVAEQTRELVQRTAKKMGYRRDVSAQSLRTGKTGLIGVISSRFSPYSMQRLNAVCRHLTNEGRTTFHYLVDNTAKSLEQACDAMMDAKVDGVLFVSTPQAFSQPAVNRLLRHGIVVSSLGMPSLEHVPKFLADKQAGARDLTRHLIDEGHRSIALLARDVNLSEKKPLRNWHARSLIAGFQQAARKCHKSGGRQEFTYQRLLLSWEETRCDDMHYLYAPGYIAMQHLISSGAVPDALFCQVDTWAMGALRACAEAGLSVPQDMALAGFENDPVSTAGTVPLTSVSQPHEELAALCVERLLGLIKGDYVQEDSFTVIPCAVIVRRSSLRLKKARR